MRNMAEVNSLLLMEMYTKGSGIKTKSMASVKRPKLMVVCMMENGIKINGTERVNVFMLTIEFTKENG